MKSLKALFLVTGSLFASSVYSANVTCEIFTEGGGLNLSGQDCYAINLTNENYARVVFTINDLTNLVNAHVWQGCRASNNAKSCSSYVRAGSTTSASAIVLYKDGTWDRTNRSTATFEF
ncbi:hypothetical protein [Pseudoalteromonas luteoviolacea]|uniref:Spore coat protein U domain-containing protein n=1 Tax=Pseudoalteromonas luteoviolacea H33 TaxID=1365251 RepID=A0A166ZLW9_9GAMM|nr:hypothetical protein [Pseudoalteromonas luteoviolacea]KZN44448.1 hypothetical protein N476_05485 [Pseudoalteromonas luteoviolacea H33]KZN78465.1 hypothetical protein N477_08675 [Pseudoalteromonas luteoviolacea H33-S]MBQ4878059.1 hypothetical protein [Pseudoalteromonas luteoviolacea]MBQ4907087.1 hypothetical protein [Pseudoalteromonas luteoviolacea]